MYYVVAILLLCAIVLFHELGHFLAAKACKIKVNEFALGLGPTIVSFGKGETKYAIKAFPIGGACIMEGEDEDTGDPGSFQKASVFKRILVVAAGPVFNIILGYVLALVIIFSLGTVKPVVGYVVDGYPAQEAGIEEGDVIKKIGSWNVNLFDEISLYNMLHQGEDVEVTYERDGVIKTVTLEPVYDEDSGSYYIGLGSSGYEAGGFFENLVSGVYEIKYWIRYTFGCLKMLVTGKAGIGDLTGPVGIVKFVGDSASEAASAGIMPLIRSLCMIGILISVNLGIINLLPLPALDGGRLLFFIIEIIRGGKRIPQEKEAMVHMVGMICLFALMFFIIFQDVFKIASGSGY